MLKLDPSGSSYRDPAGFVFMHDNVVHRQINTVGQKEYDLLMASGLYEELTAKGMLIPHADTTISKLPKDAKRYKIIKPQQIPFISYPYEWSYAQLKDAALLTIRIQQIALTYGMTLKDASAYNVQFIGKNPVFIDTLSFTSYKEGKGWEGYKQFCEHFVIPLAVASFAGENVIKMLQTYLEGIPLTMAVKLLPKRARFKKGLLSHVYFHASAQLRHQGAGTKSATAPARSVSRFALNGLMASLEITVKSMKAPNAKTEWGDYYEFTNYQAAAFTHKAKVVEELLSSIKTPVKMVWDIGANNGEFSEIAAKKGIYTVAWDIDPKAVAYNYLKKDAMNTMLPLVQDIVAPSPAIGWELTERFSLIERGPADVVLALAVIHHLAIGRNVPLSKIASMLSGIGNHIIIEFVPKSDSKVKQLFASRTDIFPDYDAEQFEKAMADYFKLQKKVDIKGSERTIYLYSK